MRTIQPLLREVYGRLLRRLRQSQGRTLAEVAAEAGVSMAYLSEIERGLKDPSSEMLAAVAGALGLTVLELGMLTVSSVLAVVSVPSPVTSRAVGSAAPHGALCLAA